MRLYLVVLGIVASLAGASSGEAGDVAAAFGALPAAVARPTWTGFYVGAHIGGAWGRTGWTDPLGPPFDLGSDRFSDVIGGGQAGFDYQLGAFVGGVEGTYSRGDLRASHASIPEPADILQSRVRWLATVSGRLGYAITPELLVYGRLGGAWMRSEHQIVDLGVLENVGSATRSGWLAGLGAEYRVYGNWSVKLEYNYMDFGTRRLNFVDLEGGPPVPFDIRQDLHTILLGVNYRFGVPATAAVVAKN